MQDLGKHVSLGRLLQDAQQIGRRHLRRAAGEQPPPPILDEQARLQDQLKRDPQLQRAIDLLKAMKIMDKTTRPAGPPSTPQVSVR